MCLPTRNLENTQPTFLLKSCWPCRFFFSNVLWLYCHSQCLNQTWTPFTLQLLRPDILLLFLISSTLSYLCPASTLPLKSFNLCFQGEYLIHADGDEMESEKKQSERWGKKWKDMRGPEEDKVKYWASNQLCH